MTDQDRLARALAALRVLANLEDADDSELAPECPDGWHLQGHGPEPGLPTCPSCGSSWWDVEFGLESRPLEYAVCDFARAALRELEP